MSNSTPQPLEGVKVIDFTQVMFGPCATLMLADYGADVIKIERPGAGDLIRHVIEDDPDGIDNPVYRAVNRNKRSITVDVRTEQGKQAIHDLVRSADVVVDNFRAGVMDRLGFSYERLAQINPRIISASGTGFGAAGPLAHKGGQDVLLQALSGVMGRKANAGQPSFVFATALCDYTAGMHLTQAILLALLQRGKTGRGQKVSVAMLDSMLAMQMQEIGMWLQRRENLNWGDRPLTGVFPTTDGEFVIVGAFKDDPLRLICNALGLPNLSEDPRYAGLPNQVARKAELQAMFAEITRGNTTAHWIERFEEQDILCAPVLSMADVLNHPQTQHNGNLISLDDGQQYFGSPIMMDDGAFRVRHSPPGLGEHGREVLAEIGYSQEQIDRVLA